MNSMTRVMTALGYEEPDRVPLFLNLTITGAKELEMSIKDYYSSADHVVKGQLLMKNKYSNDMVTNFLYSAAEVEAWGGEVVFYEDGPPNSGEPFIKKISDIYKMEIPNIHNTACLLKGLEIIKKLKNIVNEDTPIIGAVTAPFSLPVMQMGFEKYLELIYFRNDEFNQLMRINEEFCVAWANAQLSEGATAISYANPLASPSIVERDTYISTGFEVAKRTIARIKGPVATNLASGIALPVIKDLIKTGTKAVAVSAKDDIDEAKRIANKEVAIIGNLNAIDMANWDRTRTRKEVKALIQKAAKGGGFILSDNHGEIPYQVSEDVLLEMAETVKESGTYPIQGEF
jgi:uroporphyrinogen decarboxylase